MKGNRDRKIQRDVVEVDHTNLDLFVVDVEKRMARGRPWVMFAIDVHSNRIVDMYISPKRNTA